jgi:hypothetical protein
MRKREPYFELDPDPLTGRTLFNSEVMRWGEAGASRDAYPKGYPRERIARAVMRVARRLKFRRRRDGVREGGSRAE